MTTETDLTQDENLAQDENPPQSETSELDIPDLSVGVVLGIKTDNSFYLHQIRSLREPLQNVFVLEGLLQTGLHFISGIVSEMTKTGTMPRLTQLLSINKSVATGLSTLAKGQENISSHMLRLTNTFTKLSEALSDLKETPDKPDQEVPHVDL